MRSPVEDTLGCLVSLHQATKKAFQEVTKNQLLQGFTVQHDKSRLLRRPENSLGAVSTTHKIRTCFM